MKQLVFVRPPVGNRSGRIMCGGRVLGSLLNVGIDLNQIKLQWSEETETCGQVTDTCVQVHPDTGVTRTTIMKSILRWHGSFFRNKQSCQIHFVLKVACRKSIEMQNSGDKAKDYWVDRGSDNASLATCIVTMIQESQRYCPASCWCYQIYLRGFVLLFNSHRPHFRCGCGFPGIGRFPCPGTRLSKETGF